MSATMMSSPRSPWETASATLATGRRIASQGDVATRLTPITIRVTGTPIRGRHLVRAPWTEPLSAFAGVIVETQQVPDEWLRPRTPAGARQRPWVAIPVLPDPPLPAAVASPVAPAPDAAPVTTVPVRVVPAVVRPEADWTAPVRPPAAPLRDHGNLVAPRTPRDPAPGRRGLLGRVVTLSVGLVVSLVAFEVASRVGRR